jgi:hypothetical protein
MKTFLQLIFSLWLILFSTNLTAQTWNWASRFGSDMSNDFIQDMVADNQGNTYLAGSFIDPITTAVDTITSLGGIDLFIAKYDSSGNLLWLRSGGGSLPLIPFFSSSESISGIDVDEDGNLFVAGRFEDTLTFGNITVVNPNVQISTAVFVAKFNTNGTIQWIRTGIGTNSPLFPTDFNSFNNVDDLEVDDLGNVYITGRYRNPLTFSSFTIPFQNGASACSSCASGFLVKYDTNGSFKFGAETSAVGEILNNSVLEINKDSLILLNNRSSPNSIIVVNYDTIGTFLGNNVLTGLNNFGGLQLSVDNNGKLNFLNNSILSQRDNANNIIWSKQLNSSIFFNGRRSLLTDTSNNIYISGFFSDFLTIDTNVIQRLGFNLFVAKFSNNGDFQWARTAGSSNGNINNVTSFVNNQGDVYSAGLFSGTARFDSNEVENLSGLDFYVAKLGCEPRPISAVIGDTLVCLGTSNYTAVNNSLGNNFIWTISGGGTLTDVGKVANINWTTAGTHTVTVTQTNECGIGATFTFNVIVKTVPTLSIINGDNTDCLGSAAYNILNNSGTGTYAWTLSGGGNLFPLGNTAIVNWAVTGSHILSVTASNICGIGVTGTLPVTIAQIPSQTSPINGSTNVCQSTQTYTIPQSNSVNYTWSLSSGGTITANGNTATINWTTAGTHTLSVTPFNDCGVGSARSILVTVTEVPQQPSTVVGNLTVCQGLQSYSVIGNTSTNYNWTISGGGNISAANSNATVNWQTVGTYTMTITPSNVCGTGTPRTVTITVLDVPNQPTNILGIDTVCIGTQNYSVAPQSGVNFNWQLSSGGTVLPNNNLATINWTTPGTYTITVTPSNTCGTGQTKSTLVFVKNTTAQITTINGENEPCLNIENYSVPSIGGLTYNWNVTGGGTITELGNAAFVDWANTGIYTLSVATSDGCSNSLTVAVEDVPTQPLQIFGDTTVCLSFYNYSVLNVPNVNYIWTLSGGGILSQSGNAANINWTQTGVYTLTATPSNDCGLGTPRSQTITVLTVPTQPSVINSTSVNDTLACLNLETYSVNNQADVTYNWSLSGNGTLTTNNNSATINWLTPSVDNILTVTTSNICGTSSQVSKKIDVLAIPQVAQIQGNTTVCLGTTQSYSIITKPENTYNWNLSSGGVLTVVNNAVSINWTTAGIHILSVTPTNICGSGLAKILQITVNNVPTQPIGFAGTLNACQTIESYGVTAQNGVSYTWNLGGGGSLVSLSNTANVNWTIPGNHNLTITPNNQCGTGTPLIQTITVQNVPASPSAIIGIDSTCLNTTTTFSTAIQNGITYSWGLSNGGVLNPNANNATVNWNANGNQILSVSAINTCGTSIPRTKNITVLSLPTQPIISGDVAVCQNDTKIYLATSNATNYIWNTTGGTVNGNTVNWATLGTQILTVTPINFCGNGTSASANIVVGTVPNITQSITGDSVVCAGLSAYSLPQINTINYTWNISGGGTIQVLNSSVNVNWITPGTYTLTAIPSNICGNGNPITKQITVRTTPNTPTTIQGLDSICTVQGTYTVATETGVTYLWNLGSGGIITPFGNGTISILWTNVGTHTITVTPVNICGIQGTPITKTVTVLIPPQLAGDIFGATQVCNGETEDYLLSGVANWNYDWTIDNSNTLTPNSNQVTIDFNTIGTTTLSVTVGNQCGIAPTKIIEITVADNAPTLTSDISGDTLVCRNSDAVYSVTNNPAFDYNWLLNSGGNLSTLGNSSIVTWQTAGTYNLGVAASNFCGTGDTLFQTVTVENPLFTPQITLANDTLFSNNNALSQWFFNGEPINNATGSFFRPVNNGIYNVQSENICGITNTSNDFSFGLEGGLFLYPNPGRYFITLRVPEYLTWYSVDAIDQLGREVLQPIQYDGSNEVLIDVQSLPAGIYWFRIDTEIILLYRKVVILD